VLAHSVPAPQLLPSALSPHDMLLHVFGDEHCPLVCVHDP